MAPPGAGEDYMFSATGPQDQAAVYEAIDRPYSAAGSLSLLRGRRGVDG